MVEVHEAKFGKKEIQDCFHFSEGRLSPIQAKRIYLKLVRLAFSSARLTLSLMDNVR